MTKKKSYLFKLSENAKKIGKILVEINNRGNTGILTFSSVSSKSYNYFFSSKISQGILVSMKNKKGNGK